MYGSDGAAVYRAFGRTLHIKASNRGGGLEFFGFLWKASQIMSSQKPLRKEI